MKLVKTIRKNRVDLFIASVIFFVVLFLLLTSCAGHPKNGTQTKQGSDITACSASMFLIQKSNLSHGTISA